MRRVRLVLWREKEAWEQRATLEAAGFEVLHEPLQDQKASGRKSDLTQNHVRRSGLDRGLVDFKIWAIDDTWSGLCFAQRKD
jgi:hypothetical protein